MLTQVKDWLMNNQKIAIIGGVVVAVAYFGYKFFIKKSRSNRVTRRA